MRAMRRVWETTLILNSGLMAGEPTWTAAKIEFLAEDELIVVTPKISMPILHFISVRGLLLSPDSVQNQ